MAFTLTSSRARLAFVPPSAQGDRQVHTLLWGFIQRQTEKKICLLLWSKKAGDLVKRFLAEAENETAEEAEDEAEYETDNEAADETTEEAENKAEDEAAANETANETAEDEAEDEAAAN